MQRQIWDPAIKFIGRNSVFADKHFTEKIDLN